MKFLGKLFFLALMLPALAVAREVPIEDFFRNSEFESVSLSPDAKHLAVIIPQEDRAVLAVIRVSDRKVIGKWDYGENRHFYDVTWANNKRLLFWIGFKLGRYDFTVDKGDMYASNIDGTGRLDIPNGTYYSIVDTTPEDPDNILVERSYDNAFLFKLNVNTGRVTTVATAPMDFGSFVLDDDLEVKYAFGQMEDRTAVSYRRDGDKWIKIHESKDRSSTFMPVGMAEDGKHVYVLRDENGAPAALKKLNPETNVETMVSSNDRVTPINMLVASDRRTLLAVEYEDGTPEWDFVNTTHSEAKVYIGLIKAFPGKALAFGGTSEDGRFVAFTVYSDRSPGEAYLFDSKTGKADFLLSSRSWIKPEEMSPMRPITVKTRDGGTIYGYLTIPNGSAGKNLPLIVNPHGGPHGIRDEWGFNSEVQLFANRGYAVLQINYRGSGGYGDKYERIGYRKWGTLMQDDLTDSVKSLVSQGIVDKERVCIYGASYGGYAALMSATREPDLYKCTVGYVGVYDLDIQRAKSDTAQSKYGMHYLNEVQPTSAAERASHSPAYQVERLKIPVMLVHGEKDQRVPIKHMHFLISQMKKAGKKPEIVVVEPKESHGFRNVGNNVNLYSKMLPFFDKYIGPKTDTASTSP